MKKKIKKNLNLKRLMVRIGLDQDYQYDIVTDDSPQIIINKARGIGMSSAIAFKKFLEAQLFPGEYIFISQRKENSEHLLQYVLNFYRKLVDAPELEMSKLVSRGSSMIRFANGSQIISLPNMPDAVRTWHGDVWLDEFAFIFHDYQMLGAVDGCLVPDYQLIISSTPNGRNNEFFKIWHNESKFWKKYYLPYNVCKIKGYKERIETKKENYKILGKEEWFRQEYCCEFLDLSSFLFSMPVIEPNIDRFIDLNNPNNKPEYIGIDVGKKIDKSAAWGVTLDNGIVKVNFKIEFNLKEEFSEQIKKIVGIAKNNDRLKRIFVDATGLGEKFFEDLKNSDVGYLVKPVYFTNEQKETMVLHLYGLFRGGKIKIPNDKRLIDQINGLERTETETGRIRYSHVEGGHDDEFWALCLACEGVRTQKYQTLTQENIKITGKSRFLPHKKVSRGEIWNYLS